MGRIKYKIKESLNNFKYKRQRFKRGFSDCDIFEIDTWFINIIPEMLKELRNHINSIPQMIIDEYFEENKEELAKHGYKDSLGFDCYGGADNAEYNKKIEDDCYKKWLKIIDDMIFYFNESVKDKCSKENKYDKEYEAADKEYSEKYGSFGEKTFTKEELEEYNKKGFRPVRLMSTHPDYEPIYDKWRAEENKIEDYCDECKRKALDMFIKYLSCLYY